MRKHVAAKRRKAANKHNHKHNHKKKEPVAPVVIGEIDPSKFYRENVYGEALFGAKRTARKAMIENGDIPPPVRRGPKIKGWYGSTIIADREKAKEAAQKTSRKKEARDAK
jgi:hypothetical protein